MAGDARRIPAEIAAAYRRLSPRTQRAVLVLLALEVCLIAVTERDIQQRPGDRIRGPKLLWRVVGTQNVVGPAAYFAFGRRRGA